MGTDLGIDSGYRIFRGGDAEAVEALVCKTGLSGFESHRYLHSFSHCSRERNSMVVNREYLEGKISVADDGSRTEMIGFAGD